MSEVDLRLSPLAPHERDDSAELHLLELHSEHSRLNARVRLERLAPMLAKVVRHSKPGHRKGSLRLRPRLGAVPWRAITPELCAHVRDQLIAECPTLIAANAATQPLRGTLRIALRNDRGRLYDCLAALRIEGTNAERAESQFWFEHEREASDSEQDAASASQ